MVLNLSTEPVRDAQQAEPENAFVPRLRLRTRFLLSMLLISAGLTTTSLLLVQRSVHSHVREGLRVDLRNSVSTFENFQHVREKMLTRSAELLADLPITRALMTSHDPATIQDASADVSQLAGSDLFVLVDRNGSVVGLHTKSPGFTRETAQKYFHQSLDEEDSRHWWLGDHQFYQALGQPIYFGPQLRGHHLSQPFVQPIYFGAKPEGPLLGFLVIGYEIDDRLAQEVSKVSASQVAFLYGNEVVASTLAAAQKEKDSPVLRELIPGSAHGEPRDVKVGNEHFLATSLDLSGQQSIPVRLSVLGSYDEATRFLDQLNRLLLLLGLAAVLVGR